MSEAIDQFKAAIQAFQHRITELQDLKTQAIASALTDVAPELVTDTFTDEIGRPYDAEVDAIHYKINVRKIEFASSLL